MSDDLSKRQPQDASKINVHEKWELDYWKKKLDVAEEELKAAVHAVGTGVEKVKQYLKK